MLIRAVTVHELLAKGRDLFAAHHRESGLELSDPSLDSPLSIDADIFDAMERAGVLLAFGLFTPEDWLVGYAIATLTKHHYTNQKVCSACALFVKDDYRRGGNGKRLMDVLEASAELQGATTHWHAKAGSRFERILEGRGARQLETVYVSKRKTNG